MGSGDAEAEARAADVGFGAAESGDCAAAQPGDSAAAEPGDSAAAEARDSAAAESERNGAADVALRAGDALGKSGM